MPDSTSEQAAGPLAREVQHLSGSQVTTSHITCTRHASRMASMTLGCRMSCVPSVPSLLSSLPEVELHKAQPPDPAASGTKHATWTEKTSRKPVLACVTGGGLRSGCHPNRNRFERVQGVDTEASGGAWGARRLSRSATRPNTRRASPGPRTATFLQASSLLDPTGQKKRSPCD